MKMKNQFNNFLIAKRIWTEMVSKVAVPLIIVNGSALDRNSQN